ncbi:PKD domain-containing protein [Inhella gelatinilytica]|uniref:PKD domain-containing protein n=1 Tax=Inhella gelatinilytica TaxID=2795030 RepID=A0A931IYE2_9BURK|nr:PKD domain-containing protein [Inhella gelatinilytica]MBH9553275.1 PKD domain-containing protein [Inhella gelatinilytica]
MKRFGVKVMGGLVLALVIQGATAQPGGTAARKLHPARAAFPSLQLPAVVQGQSAIEALGARLPEVATWYGQSPEEFAALLRRDNRLRLDRQGRLFAVDTLETPLAALPDDQKTLHDGTLLPLEQTFLLHSRPGAQRTIYLNFKGATLVGTAWNGSASSITALPYDLDGLPYSFNSTELQRIQGIWQRVAEDYAPFDVNVTTEAPPAEALSRSSGTDSTFGTTVLITHSNGVYSCSCGGVAYLGVFDDTTEVYKPALVFYNQLGSGNEKYVAEAISHEAGHNLGLQHDGYAGGGYYGGHGTGTTGWAPIMGVGYAKSLVQWSKGEYSTATNLQDDFKVAESYGAPLRADDHGNVLGTATMLTGVNSGGVATWNETGVIERAGDVDVFRFNAGAGQVTLVLQPVVRSANLDALIEVRDAGGALLAQASPLETLNASLTLTVPGGTYFVLVTGTGKGDPGVDGYSAYGSVGRYRLTVSAPVAGGQAPLAVASATPVRGTAPLTVSFSGAGSSDPDGQVVAWDWNYGDGQTASGVSTAYTYTSPGSYAAQLRVTDNSGLSSVQAVTIQVDPAVSVVAMGVADIAMSAVTSGKDRWRAQAAIKVVDAQGRNVAGASVSVRWGGLVSGTATATTGSTGVALVQSGTTRSAGSISVTVTGVQLSGYQYDAARNVEGSDVISR